MDNALTDHPIITMMGCLWVAGRHYGRRLRVLAKSEGMKKAKDIEKLAPIPTNGSKPQSSDIAYQGSVVAVANCHADVWA